MRAFLSDEPVAVEYCPRCGANTAHYLAVFRIGRRVQVGIARSEPGDEFRICASAYGGCGAPEQAVAALPDAWAEVRGLRFSLAKISRRTPLTPVGN